MNNNIDYEKTLAAEQRKQREWEKAEALKKETAKQEQIEKEKELLRRGYLHDYDFWPRTEPQPVSDQQRLNNQRKWLKEYLKGEKMLYPFPPVVPDDLAQWIAGEWQNAERIDYVKNDSRPDISEMPEQVQKIIQEFREKERREEEAWEEEQQSKKEKERKQRESARWAWENGRKKRLLTDKTNTELLAMIELNLREISYWLEHYAFKSRRY